MSAAFPRRHPDHHRRDRVGLRLQRRRRPALAATWGAPKAMRCDLEDNIIVVDTENFAVRRIDPRTASLPPSPEDGRAATGMAARRWRPACPAPHGCGISTDGNLYIADTHNNRVRAVGL